MIESLAVTLLPTMFLIVLFGGEELFRRKNIDMDGEPPIDKTLFYLSKYSILVMWGGMVVQSWGIHLAFIPLPERLKGVALSIWVVGFALLFMGRFRLGESFRLGSPKERTRLQVKGLFRFSRNPMYFGMYATLLAAVLYTLNPILFCVGIFVVAVHHRIVLAEERHLQKVFGEEYTEYCGWVRRYL